MFYFFSYYPVPNKEPKTVIAKVEEFSQLMKMFKDYTICDGIIKLDYDIDTSLIGGSVVNSVKVMKVTSVDKDNNVYNRNYFIKETSQIFAIPELGDVKEVSLSFDDVDYFDLTV
jgi:predicted transcriptional regulator